MRAAPDLPPRRLTDALLRHIPMYREFPHILLADVLGSLVALGERMPREAVMTLLDGALAELETGGPAPGFEGVTDGARFWAEIASRRELEAHFLAALRRLRRDRGQVAPAARKRLLVDLWAGLPEADRRAFLERVDPEGVFRAA